MHKLLFLCFLWLVDTGLSAAAGADELVRGTVSVAPRRPSMGVRHWEVAGAPRTATASAAIDTDGDHRAELLFCGEHTAESGIARVVGDGQFVFTPRPDFPSGARCSFAAVYDFDHDRCDDIFFPPVDGGPWEIYRSDCRGGFESRRETLFKSKPPAVVQPVTVFFKLPGKFQVVLCDPVSQRCYTVVCDEKFVCEESLPWISRDRYHVARFTATGGTHLVLEETDPLGRWKLPHDVGPGYWALFPELGQWRRAAIGDVDGDGFDDIVELGNRIVGWWVALSTGRSGVELPLGGVPYRDTPFVLADIDGDRRAELVLPADEKAGLDVYSWRAGEPLHDATVRLSSGASAVVDHAGRFELVPAGDEPLAAFATAPGRELFPSPGAFLPRERTVHFTAAPPLARSAPGVVPYGPLDESQQPVHEGPYLCLGYQPASEGPSKWGKVIRCQKGYAYYGAPRPGHADDVDRLLIASSCCKLPFSDILTDEEQKGERSCPDGFVATGFFVTEGCERCSRALRCTKINQEKYQLGPAKPGKPFGVSMAMAHWTDQRIEREDLPLGIRYGIERTGFENWSSYGCVGSPPGSLLVAKDVGTCADLRFRELQYTGRKGGPKPGSPVPMFPDCASIESKYDPRARCVVK